MTVRTVSVALKAQVAEYTAKLGQARKITKDLLNEVDKLGKDHKDKFNQLTLGAGAAGIALLGVAGAVVKVGMQFDKQMSAVGAVASGTADDLNKLRDAALAAGKATSYSATEAARAEEELAKAGIKTTDILSGGLTGALNLAAAGQMELADAATIAAQAMNVFQLNGAAVPHIADVLAAASNKSAAGMKDLGDALKQGGLVAASTGLTLEDTVGTLAAFADRALVGSDAGTSLKTMLQMLAGPSEKTAKLMKELGINVYDAQGNFIGIVKLAGLLQEKLGGLTQAQRNYAMQQIFGSDATRAANVLYSIGADKLQDYIDAVNDSGSAAETARKKTDNLAGDIERLKGSIETLAIESSSGANGGLRVLTKAADELVSSIAEAPPIITQTGVVLTALGGIGLLAVAGFLKVRQAVKDAVEALEGMGPAGQKAGVALNTTAKWAGRAAAAFAALEVVNTVAAMFRPAAVDTETLAGSLDHLAKASGDASEATKVTGKDYEQTFKDLKFAWNSNGKEVGKGLEGLKKAAQIEPGFMENFGGSTQATLKRLQELDAALASMAKNGHGREAAEVFLEIKQRADELGIPFDELRRMFPEYSTAIDEVAKGTTTAGTAMDSTATKASGLVESMTEMIDAGKQVKDVFDELNGKALTLAETENKLYDSFDKAKESIKENGKTLDVHTEAGRKNREALLGIAGATRDVLQAMQDSGAPLADINAKYQEARTAFIKAAMAMGSTRAEAIKLADQWVRMPPVVVTEVKTPGLTTASDRVRVLGAQLAALPSSKTIRITTYDKMVTLHGDHAQRWGGITRHAQTGLLRDAGVYSAVSPARYAFAEPATGGEAFIPRKGDYGRSMGILNQAAAWYGASVMPGGFGTRASSAPPVIVQVNVSGGSGSELSRALMSTLRAEVSQLGGDVQDALGSRKRGR